MGSHGPIGLTALRLALAPSSHSPATRLRCGLRAAVPPGVEAMETPVRAVGGAHYATDAAPAGSSSLAGGEQAKAPLIQMRSDRFIAHTNGVPIDHFVNI